MPQGSKAIPAGKCPMCSGPQYVSIVWTDGFVEEVMETHCRQCGYAVDGEGRIRSMPTNEALMTTLRSKEF